MSDKNKAKVYANFAGKKSSQLGKHVVNKVVTKIDSVTVDNMALSWFNACFKQAQESAATAV